jgi:hypothetical protein
MTPAGAGDHYEGLPPQLKRFARRTQWTGFIYTTAVIVLAFWLELWLAVLIVFTFMAIVEAPLVVAVYRERKELQGGSGGRQPEP